jgi:soluble lytic murein transglycosylase-like protein
MLIKYLNTLRLIVAKHFLYCVLLACLLAERCLAADSASGASIINSKASSVVDYEQQVREVAKRTAAEAKARKEQERLERAKAASDNKNVESYRVFKYKKDGATAFSDSAPYKIKYEVVIYNSCYACSIASSVDWYKTRLHLTEFSDTISLAAQAYKVDIGFIRAIIHAESAFNPLARSRKGAMGLMQLMPGTAKDMGVLDSANPEQNIKGGVRYLASLLQTFNGNEMLAAAAYNAGPGAVTRHGGIPPFEETQTYVKRVKILADRYKSQKQVAMN